MNSSGQVATHTPSLMDWRCSVLVTWATPPASLHLPYVHFCSFLYLHSMSSSSCTLQSAPPWGTWILTEALKDPVVLP